MNIKRKSVKRTNMGYLKKYLNIIEKYVYLSLIIHTSQLYLSISLSIPYMYALPENKNF